MVEKTKAHELAEQQREISVSEFFAKNRHLLGFDNPRKALLMAVKEAVDNSIDATLDAKFLPDIYVELQQLKEDRFKVIVEDNGPGILKEQIPKVFGKLLYGSKFHRMRQSMGQQGIGISAVLLYGQLTTGKGMHITSKIGPKHPAHFYEIHIDTQKNEPIVRQDKIIEWNKDHGTRIEIELQGAYQKGKQSVDEYLREIALINPYTQITYKTPEKETITYLRAVSELPKEAKEVKPHPYGVELGVLIRMMQATTSGTVSGFLQHDFCRISQVLAQDICKKAAINPRARPTTVARDEAEALYNVIQNTKIIAPPTDCLSPLGEEGLLKGLKKEIDAEFYTAVTRTPSVYRGIPFLIEVAAAYGGSLEKEEPVRIIRFANRVPLLYQQGACATTESIIDTSWKNYNLSQSKESIPIGPVVLVIHVVSVWVPFTSEAKEAIAHYPEIIKDMKLALQEAGRKISAYIRKTVKAREQQERVDLFEKYIPELAHSLSNLTGDKKATIEEHLQKVLKKGLKDLLAEVKAAENTKIKGENIAFGEKQQTLSEVEDER
ncbi:MAG TPA: DNA topoisomerase VI subunit B [Candidatus Nanoarchaeia archaeon]|nr:DNA topoisomerase VI subunit B [Candidatus Nanoarchaeia archaeon]